jgi:LuxR family maltose regulon positive regulatory protein
MKGIPPSFMDNVSLLIGRYNLVEGRLKDDRDQIQKAVDGLENLLTQLDRAGLMEHKIEANVLLSLAYHELDHSPEMIQHLEAALKIAEPEEYRQVFIDEGIPMSRLLVHYMAYLKQNKHGQDVPSRTFVSDLLFRLTEGNQNNRVDQPKEAMSSQIDTLVVELLTPREHEVLQLVSKGRTNGEIAYELHISINTVKRHMNNIFMKLGVSTRTQAIRVGQTKELIK